jgi:alkylation response protein AidB-like acyl-CoA dehydrogenase
MIAPLATLLTYQRRTMANTTPNDLSTHVAESDAFKAIVDRIADAAPTINEQRQIPDELIDAMVDLDLFRLLVPKSLGGGEIDFLDYLAITQAIAYADASTAWCFNQNNVLGTNSSLMPEALAKEIWIDARAIVCNGPPQNVVITPTDKGYTVSGRWNFSSGSRHANWVSAAGRLENGDTLLMMIPKSQVEFIDVWHVSGLRGTGSFSFEVKDLHVPAGRAFIEAETPRDPGPLYQIPRSLHFAAGFASVGLGVARAGLDAAVDLSLAKTPQEQIRLKDQTATQGQIGQAEAHWAAANAYLQATAATLWANISAGQPLTTHDRIHLRLASTHAIREAVLVVDLAYTIGGASSIFESHPIQRRFQDAHAITQQIQGRLEHYETAGQFILGLEPQGRMF